MNNEYGGFILQINQKKCHQIKLEKSQSYEAKCELQFEMFHIPL